MRLASLAGGLAVAYPALVYVGLTVFEPRALGALLLAILLLRQAQGIGALVRGSPTGERWLLAVILGLSLAIVIANQEWLLRIYPLVMSAGMLALFGRSLFHPPTVIERIARLREPDLSPAGVHYTRRVTVVWCAFFIVNGLVALATVFASREIWALWNGLLSYLAMGALFAVEWVVRRYVRRTSAA